jgi:MFS family permease
VAHWLRDRGLEAFAVRGGVPVLLPEAVAPPPGGRPGARRVAAPRTGPLGALRYKRFRRYSAGVLFSLIGNWIEASAFGYVVLLLGGSAATLGLIGFLNSIPNLIFGLPAGALADRYDRRKLIFLFQGLNMLVAASLAVLWTTGRLSVVTMGALAIVGGTLGTLSFPAFQGMIASMVPKEELESAVAVNSLSLQVARFIGPAISGYLLATAGPTAVFSANAASFLAVLGTVALLPGTRTVVSDAASRLGGAMSEGVRYVFSSRSMASLMVLMLFAGLFATPPVAFMLPAIVRFQLDAGAATLGLLTAFIGLGSVLGSVGLLLLSRRPNKGEPALIAYFVTAIAIAAIGLSPWVPLSFALGLVGGLCGVVFIGISTVVVQAMSSEEMRARAMAVWAAAFVGMLPIGALITAGLTAWLGPGGAVFVDGLATLVGGLLVVLVRPEVTWLGCAALPEACVAATDPTALAFEPEPALAGVGAPTERA